MLRHRLDALRNHGFFYNCLRNLQDLDIHPLLTEKPLKLANPPMGIPQGTHRHDVHVRGDGRGSAGFEAPLPLPHQQDSPIRV